jgi:hypothetical protein
MGIHPLAKEEKDRYDYPEPPMVEKTVSAGMEREWDGRKVRYVSDIRAPAEDGMIWRFDVNDVKGETRVECSKPPALKNNWKVYLYDSYRKFAFDVDEDSVYSFTSAKGAGRSFMLVAGTEEYCGRIIRNFAAPQAFELSQNYPNPIRQHTYIYYQLPGNGNVKLEIYDLQGRLVQQLVNSYMESGYYRITWNSRDEKGRQVASGVYAYKMSVRDRSTGSTLFNGTRIMRVLR